MDLTGILLLTIGLIIGAGIVFFMKRSSEPDQQQMKDAFGNLSKEALDQNIDTFMKIAESKFGDLLKSSDAQLDEKKKLIDSSLEEMKKQLEGLNKQTTELTGQMEASSKGVSELSDVTSQLSQILDSSQARGQWGERMVQDILDHLGLKKGINFKTQSGSKEGKPDFTFLLPQGMRLNMDVKFPWTHYANLFSVESDTEKASERKSFLQDVKGHIKSLTKRDYIDTADGTMDFVLMFIPNEGIYAFLNKPKTGEENLVEFAMKNKVLLCSPITLFAILAMVRQSVKSFNMESKALEIQDHVTSFRVQWKNFLEKMEKLGNTLGTLSNHYDDLSGPRKRALEKPMEKIKELQLGQSDDVQEIEGDDE